MKQLTFEEAKNVTFNLDEVCNLVKLTTALEICSNRSLFNIGLHLILKDKYHLYIANQIQKAIIDEMLDIKPNIRDIIYTISQERLKEKKIKQEDE